MLCLLVCVSAFGTRSLGDGWYSTPGFLVCESWLFQIEVYHSVPNATRHEESAGHFVQTEIALPPPPFPTTHIQTLTRWKDRCYHLVMLFSRLLEQTGIFLDETNSSHLEWIKKGGTSVLSPGKHSTVRSPKLLNFPVWRRKQITSRIP